MEGLKSAFEYLLERFSEIGRLKGLSQTRWFNRRPLDLSPVSHRALNDCFDPSESLNVRCYKP